MIFAAIQRIAGFRFSVSTAVFCFLYVLSINIAFAQDPAPAQEIEVKLKFTNKLTHWMFAYGLGNPEFMEQRRNDFKTSSYAEVYIEGIIDHDAWMFTLLNKVTKFRHQEKQTPHLIFEVKFKPTTDALDNYTVTLTVQKSGEISQDLESIANAAGEKYFKGKNYAEPAIAVDDIEKALTEALDGVEKKLGNVLAPNLMVRYLNEVFWNGHEIPILDSEGNSVELEAIDKEGKVLDPGQITWTNADPFQSKGVVDMTGVNSKSVTLTKQGEARPLNVTVVRAGSSDDINELLKMLIVEALTSKKQEALDSLTILRQDSINNANSLIAQITRLESGNLAMEDTGVKPVALFADPPAVSLQDSIAFQAGNDRKTGFEHLRKRKRLKNTIRKKVNVVALANLIVDQPEKINILLDALLLNSGRLVARLILNKDSQGKRDAARNIVVDFLNQNLERIAGAHFAQALEPEPPIPIPPAPTPPSFAFSPEEPLYVSPMVAFEGKETFIAEMKAYLTQVEPRVYIAINYSQDVSTESYLNRVQGVRPKGIKEGEKYIAITLVNIPGSIEAQIVATSDMMSPSIDQEADGIAGQLKSIIQPSEAQVLYVDETKEQEIARIINFIKCGVIKNSNALPIHYGWNEYRVNVGKVSSLLAFQSNGATLASQEFKESILYVAIQKSIIDNNNIIVGYEDMTLNLSQAKYNALQNIRIPAASGGLIFSFVGISDQRLKESLFQWLLGQTGLDGRTPPSFVVHSNQLKAKDIFLYSDCELEQLSRSNRKSLITELLDNQEDFLGWDKDTYQYLIINVLRTIPPGDRQYFYTLFRDNPEWVKYLYSNISSQNESKLIRIWIDLWTEFYTANKTMASNSGKLMLTKDGFGNAANRSYFNAQGGGITFIQPFRHGQTSDPPFIVNNPFDIVYVHDPQVDQETPFVVLPAIAAVYFLDEESDKTWSSLGWSGLQLGLFAVGVGEVWMGLRAATLALQGTGLLSRQFLLATARAALGTADLSAAATSDYCSKKSTEFCLTWKQYEFYINLGLFTASMADVIYTKLRREYPNIRNDLDADQRKFLEEDLGLTNDITNNAGESIGVGVAKTGEHLDEAFKSIASVQNLRKLSGISIKKISSTELKELTDLKNLYQIDPNWNVAKAEVVSLNKSLNKSEFTSHAHFDNFQSKIQNGSPSPSQNSKIFNTSTAPTESGTLIPRHNDAEVKIFEDIASQLGAKKGDVGTEVFNEVEGKIKLKTELCPCGSCSGVIEQFKKLFPKIELEILAQPKSSF